MITDQIILKKYAAFFFFPNCCSFRNIPMNAFYIINKIANFARNLIYSHNWPRKYISVAAVLKTFKYFRHWT